MRRPYLEKFFSTPQKVDVLILNKDLEFEGINQQYINNISEKGISSYPSNRDAKYLP